MATKTKPVLDGPHFKTVFPHPGEAELAQQVKDSAKWAGVIDPKFGLVYEAKPEVLFGPEMPPPWEWPVAMLHHHTCEACYLDGRTDPMSWRMPCSGFQRSHYMRE